MYKFNINRARSFIVKFCIKPNIIREFDKYIQCIFRSKNRELSVRIDDNQCIIKYDDGCYEIINPDEIEYMNIVLNDFIVSRNEIS